VRPAPYSFYPTKNLGASATAARWSPATRPSRNASAGLRNYGQSERYVHPELGMNSRLDELQAALLGERLRWLEVFTERRRAVATRYDEAIDNPRIELLARPQQAAAHVHHLYVVRCGSRAELTRHLLEREIQTLIHYPVPIHRQAPCATLRQDPGGLPHAEKHATACLTIPCHPQMTDADVEHVIDALNTFR
jgi:dTDP-4-amino-4,6-dideoxygalactose transaminase